MTTKRDKTGKFVKKAAEQPKTNGRLICPLCHGEIFRGGVKDSNDVLNHKPCYDRAQRMAATAAKKADKAKAEKAKAVEAAVVAATPEVVTQ